LLFQKAGLHLLATVLTARVEIVELNKCLTIKKPFKNKKSNFNSSIDDWTIICFKRIGFLYWESNENL